MSDSEASTQALLGAPAPQTAPAQGGRSTRAYKVAGLTLLACVLVASQAMIVYFLVNQKSDIKSLREQSSSLREQLATGRSVPMRALMRPAALINKLTFDEQESSSAPPKTDPIQKTECQQEAAGEKKLSVPGFYPKCDQHGLYKPQQCFKGQCWCVDPVSGEQVPGSLTDGSANCYGASPANDAGHVDIMLLPEDIAEKDN